MSLRFAVPSALAATLVLAAPAVADQGKSVTATGTGIVRVVPKNRNSEASIAAAVDAARGAGIKVAMKEAREYATDYANAAGLTLGAVISVSDASNAAFGYFGFPIFGAFGPNQFCGTVTVPVSKHAGKSKRFKRVHQCFVPPYEATTLTVTYAAT
jgi:uncharacterized protein YggE